ncbi:MAG: protein phosphatase 2C domain-containing protein [Gimesia sp.]
MRWEHPVQFASQSDVGFRRRNNEDSISVRICKDQESWREHGHFFLVADGMGGHAVGELASKIASETVPHTFFKNKPGPVAKSLKSAIEVANQAINERGMANREFMRMGTTCSSLCLCAEGAVIGHVGDSRVYRVRNNRIDQLTFDHSLQWELIRQGRGKPEDVYRNEPRNVITRSLGPEPVVQVDIEGPYPIMDGDRYVLCSDGLTSHLKDDEIGMITKYLDPSDACRLMINLANLRGGSDNISVIVVRVGDLPDGDFPEEQSSEEEPKLNLDLEKGYGEWFWLAGVWGASLMVAIGIAMWIITKFDRGEFLTFGGMSLLVILLVRKVFSQRESSRREDYLDQHKTVEWKPYRSERLKFNTDFLQYLTTMESELQRAAMEEEWTIEWSAHNKIYYDAKEEFEKKKYLNAFRDYSRAIDILMTGLHTYRKEMVHQARWKKNTSPPPEA